MGLLSLLTTNTTMGTLSFTFNNKPHFCNVEHHPEQK